MKELAVFCSDIGQIRQNARSRAYSEINRAMLEAFWLTGKRIVEQEQEGKTKAEYGKKLLEKLSRNLTHEFKRGEDDNPPVELLLCTSKDETIVRFSILKDSEQLFASKYRLILSSEEELIAEIERQKLLLEQVP